MVGTSKTVSVFACVVCVSACIYVRIGLFQIVLFVYRFNGENEIERTEDGTGIVII